MMSLFRFLLPCLVLSLVLCGTNHAQVPPLSGWDLVWSDEFEGPAVDETAWELLDRRDSFNNEKQYYLPEQITTHNGNARITATDDPIDGKLYRSGRMWTHDSWYYGRFEARAKLPTSQGMWPAIWLLPRGASWPTGGEIDIMENKGSEPFVTSSAYHWGASVSERQFVSQRQNTNVGGQPVNYHDSFHTYAAEWDPDAIRFYVDDVLHFTVLESTAPIHPTPKSVVLNLAVGGDFGGDPDGTTIFPQQMDIDYVRIWQREETPLIGHMVSPGFDRPQGGSLDGWHTFFDSGSNVALSTTVADEGIHSLRMSGQNNGSSKFQGASQRVPIQGGLPLRASVKSLVRASESLAGTTNNASLKVEFYSTFGAGFGTSDFLGETSLEIANASSLEDVWTQYDHLVTAPTNAVEARLTLVYRQPNNQSGAVYFDSTLVEVFVPGDFNRDGKVDAADYTVWRDAEGDSTPKYEGADGNGDGIISSLDYDLWKQNFGTDVRATATTSSQSVPEPLASTLLMAAGLVIAAIPLRRSFPFVPTVLPFRWVASRRMMMRNYVLTLALISVSLLTVGNLSAIVLSNSMPLTYDDGNGNTLLYRLYLPPGHDTPGKQFPLVLYMHGAGQIGTDNTSQMLTVDGLVLETQTTEHASFLLAPQVQPGQGGWGSFTRGMTYDLMQILEQQYSIDTSRRYATGLSMGGFGTWGFLSDHPGLFEAAVPMSGWGDPNDAQSYKPTRIWSFNGNKDTTTPPDSHRETVQALLEAGGDAIYTEVEGMHEIWGPLYDDNRGELYDWMFDGVEPPLGTLVYNPNNGSVKLDATDTPGSAINFFELRTETGPFVIPQTVLVDGVPTQAAGLFSSLTETRIRYDARSTNGFTSSLDLGAIFPAGLSFSELQEYLLRHRYLATATGRPVRLLNLTMAVPEPSSGALLGILGVVGVAVLRKRA